MAGRGRGRGGRGGRGRGGGMNMRSMGEEYVKVTEPPPLFPPRAKQPFPLTESMEMDYLLLVKQEFNDRMQSSAAYVQARESKDSSQQKIDKLLAQLPSVRERFDWNLFPIELRPKAISKKNQIISKEVDIQKTFEKLEKIENYREMKDEVKKENTESDEEELEVSFENEEVDDGTDYANNYFDNGEGFDDEDDNLDGDAIM